MKYAKSTCVLCCLLITSCLQSDPVFIEINEVPPPFDLGGASPYVVWMNGKRVKLPKADLKRLVSKVGEENIPKADPYDIHKGWLWPHYVRTEGFQEDE